MNFVSLCSLQKSGSTIRNLNNGLAVMYMDKDLLYAIIDREDSILDFIKYINSSNYTALVMSSRSMHLWDCCIDYLSLFLISTMSHCKMVKGWNLTYLWHSIIFAVIICMINPTSCYYWT